MSLILCLNAGSSSLKISVFHKNEKPEFVANASYSNINSSPQFSYSSDTQRGSSMEKLESITDHRSAFLHFLSYIRRNTEITLEQVLYVCHRVVHGGDYVEPALVNGKELDRIQSLSELAPLHNGPALSVIRAVNDALPTAKSVAFFDSSFHTSIPEHIYTYPIDYNIARDNGLRKYGFHGLSYAYVLDETSRFLAIQPSDLNLIVLHLGSGSSVCAIRAGQSLDTTMGLTPLSGLPGATRSGSIDPALLFHYHAHSGSNGLEKEKEKSKMAKAHKLGTNIGVTEAELVLNKKAGWNALAGTTDFEAIAQRAFHPGNAENVSPEETKTATLAFNLFVDRILNVLGAYHVKLSSPLLHTAIQTRKGVDAVVFTGGIGEHSVELRSVISRALIESLGYPPLDEDRNSRVGDIQGSVVEISKDDAGRTRILVARTDEQFEMAKECIKEKSFWH